MVDFTLRLSAPASPTQATLRTSFYWTPDGVSSFEGPFGPRLGKLGPVQALSADFVRLALTAFAARVPLAGSRYRCGRLDVRVG
jgi:hypothetical protein